MVKLRPAGVGIWRRQRYTLAVDVLRGVSDLMFTEFIWRDTVDSTHEVSLDFKWEPTPRVSWEQKSARKSGLFSAIEPGCHRRLRPISSVRAVR